MAADKAIYDELCCYTLERGDPSFIHQHVVDAFSAQHADENTKAIALTFALVGLYLHCERGFSGKQVQRAHMALAQQKRSWPKFTIPNDRGRMTVRDVMAAKPGAERDTAIHQWAASVWEAFRSNQQMLAELLRSYRLEA